MAMSANHAQYERTSEAREHLGTRQRILRAAEHLYAVRGFEGMSLRALTEEAGANLAAVNYHFGSKKELLMAMFREHIIPMNHERITLLSETRKAHPGEPPSLEAIFDAFLQPLARRAVTRGKPNTDFLRMVGRALAEDSDFWQRLYSENFRDLSETFILALSEALPALPKDEIRWRFHFCIGAMLGTLVKQPQFARSMEERAGSNDIPLMFTKLRDFLCAGFRHRQPSNT